jgi:hypothetical protein
MTKLIIHGLRDFNRELKELDKELPKKLKAVNLLAAQVIADEARPNVHVKSGKLQKSTKAMATPTSARVKMGSKAVPYAGAYNWGHNNRAWGGSMPGHPVVADALSAKYDEMVMVYDTAIEDLKKEIGLD